MLGKDINYSTLFIVFFSIIIVVFGTCFVTYTNTRNSKQLLNIKEEQLEAQKMNISHDKQEKSLMRELDKYENIILLGDSITEIYPVEEIFDNDKILRHGVSGYTTTNILDRIEDMVYKYNPTKVILLIGTNDIAGDISEENQNRTFQNIKQIAEEIKKNRPKTKIYIESLYPVNRTMNLDMVWGRTNEAIQGINKRIKEYCKEEKITYINLYDELTDKEGNFDERYTYDGLHPSTLGYAKITRILLPYIYE